MTPAVVALAVLGLLVLAAGLGLRALAHAAAAGIVAGRRGGDPVLLDERQTRGSLLKISGALAAATTAGALLGALVVRAGAGGGL